MSFLLIFINFYSIVLYIFYISHFSVFSPISFCVTPFILTKLNLYIICYVGLPSMSKMIATLSNESLLVRSEDKLWWTCEMIPIMSKMSQIAGIFLPFPTLAKSFQSHGSEILLYLYIQTYGPLYMPEEKKN